MATTNTSTIIIEYYDANGQSVQSNLGGQTQTQAAAAIAAAFVAGVVYRIDLNGF